MQLTITYRHTDLLCHLTASSLLLARLFFTCDLVGPLLESEIREKRYIPVHDILQEVHTEFQNSIPEKEKIKEIKKLL